MGLRNVPMLSITRRAVWTTAMFLTGLSWPWAFVSFISTMTIASPQLYEITVILGLLYTYQSLVGLYGGALTGKSKKEVTPRRLRHVRAYEFLAISTYLTSMTAKFIVTAVLYGMKGALIDDCTTLEMADKPTEYNYWLNTSKRSRRTLEEAIDVCSGSWSRALKWNIGTAAIIAIFAPLVAVAAGMYYREARRVVFPDEEEGTVLQWGRSPAGGYARLPVSPPDTPFELEAPVEDAPPAYIEDEPHWDEAQAK